MLGYDLAVRTCFVHFKCVVLMTGWTWMYSGLFALYISISLSGRAAGSSGGRGAGRGDEERRSDSWRGDARGFALCVCASLSLKCERKLVGENVKTTWRGGVNSYIYIVLF